jgi:putative phosphoribosyl transferase
MHFKDREEAGRKLAEALEKYKGEDVVVYALPRGGVVLGYEIARALNAPLDLVISRKIGYPGNEECAVCAVAEDGHMICDRAGASQIDPDWIQSQALKERQEARRRRIVYLKGREPLTVEGKTAIIVDDGVATGLTLILAIEELKYRNPKKIVVAIPVAPADTAERIRSEVDDLVAVDIPAFYLGAVGAYYDKFPQLTDEEVIDLMEKSKA